MDKYVAPSKYVVTADRSAAGEGEVDCETGDVLEAARPHPERMGWFFGTIVRTKEEGYGFSKKFSHPVPLIPENTAHPGCASVSCRRLRGHKSLASRPGGGALMHVRTLARSRIDRRACLLVPMACYIATSC